MNAQTPQPEPEAQHAAERVPVGAHVADQLDLVPEPSPRTAATAAAHCSAEGPADGVTRVLAGTDPLGLVLLVASSSDLYGSGVAGIPLAGREPLDLLVPVPRLGQQVVDLLDVVSTLSSTNARLGECRSPSA